MSYRHQQTEEETQWQEWIKAHRFLVEASGLPDIVLCDSDHWYDFLDHGILDHHDDPTRFSVDELSVRQQAALLQLLMTGSTNLLQTIVGYRLIIAMIDAVERRYKD